MSKLFKIEVCYNLMKIIVKESIETILTYTSNLLHKVSIIAVNDGSNDSTEQKVLPVVVSEGNGSNVVSEQMYASG